MTPSECLAALGGASGAGHVRAVPPGGVERPGTRDRCPDCAVLSRSGDLEKGTD